ncbi:MAG: DNA polymerase III subunit alpha [Flavobacteriales bacterium]|nr:DNA polymerase III subunit alpha [Flavobacteriales bacterium]
MFIIFDTETTGFPIIRDAAPSDLDSWSTARMVQIAWQVHDADGKLLSANNLLIRPEGFEIPYSATKIHGISHERAVEHGVPVEEVLRAFEKDMASAKYVVGHNIGFDIGVVGSEMIRHGFETALFDKADIDTKDISTDFCALPGGKGGKYKWPTLTELHTKLFGVPFEDAHDAAYDVDATARCFFGLINHRVGVPPEISNPETLVYEAPKLEKANFAHQETEVSEEIDIPVDHTALAQMEDAPFAHLHSHSQFSILQSTSTLDQMVAQAVAMGMPAIALTDHANMMGAFHFVDKALAQKIKPIVGCEFNLCRDRLDKSNKDDGYQVVLLAKNKNGYHNLAKMASIAYTEGFYYVPRIDREILEQYKGDIIALTGGLWGEVPSLVLNVGETQAEEAFLWWKEQFGADFYAEICRHGLEEETVVNNALLKFCKQHDVKYVAANNSYYSAQKDAEAHDVLLCVKDAASVSQPKKYIGKRGREFRFGFPNEEYYIKSPDEMKALFRDLPEAILNIGEVLGKVEEYKLAREVLLPKFDIPEEFRHEEDEEDGGKRGENAFLRHLTYEGAAKRYGEITPDIEERLDFELQTIANTGYPGYFLIVQDFCAEARNRGVSVGPGRGSAAGSAVAYCIGITNVDPIKYDLLFERFLNPERISLPDIDIDFDDEGRDRVIQYVIDKYGENQVAQIITYGTMAAKSSIRDTGRVLELPLPDTDRIAKLVPDIKLQKLFAIEENHLANAFSNSPEDLERARRLFEISKGTDLEAQTLNQARKLEGSVRNTGIHACGVIITPDDITKFVPVATAKDSDMWCTQFDNSVVESAGLLKMDFLGLKTLTLIKDTVRFVKEKHGVDLDPDNFPLDDEKTYELFQRGETVGIFQYESAGMQKYMKELKPTVFADLIAMNALYRPGPLEYIPSFIRRKHGQEEIVYDLPECEEYLKETYGITVYQEQVMLLSQKLGGFTKGQADMLRKGMGKKKKSIIDELFPIFVDGCVANGHPEKVVKKIWKDWEAFASYAFNKSHSTCYAWIAYQTAYLKAHYPAEYMAAVLSNNMNDIKQLTFFMEECRRMGIPVLGPSVNESGLKFTVNDEGAIRCGMAAIKGVGESAVLSIIDERQNGSYTSVFDLVRRIDLRTTNKRVLESLAYAGAFDEFAGIARSRYFAPDAKGSPFLDTLIRYGQAVKTGANSSQHSLFGEDEAADIPEPAIPVVPEWGTLERLAKEKEVVGIYISGHPLDDYKLEIDSFCIPDGLKAINDLQSYANKELSVAGMVTEAAHRFTKNNKPFGVIHLEDYDDNARFFLFGDEYLKFKDYLVEGWFLFLKGRVQTKRFAKDPSELEFKINQVELLADVRERFAKHLRISLNLNDINDDLTESMWDVLNKHRGNCKVRIQVANVDTSLEMPATNIKVELSNDLIKALDELPQLEYKIV